MSGSEAGSLQNDVIVAATAMYERIRELETERDRLREALKEAFRREWWDGDLGVDMGEWVEEQMKAVES